jgi:hypothetical protein
VLAVLVVLAVGMVSGCGDDGDLSSACDLVSRADAAQLLGVPARPGVLDDDNEGPGTTCEWISSASSTEAEAAVYGFFISESSESDARDAFEETRDSGSRISQIESVDGIGDDAYFVVYTEPNSLSGTPSLPDLHVRDGDRILFVGTFDSDEHPVSSDEARALELGAAKRALAGSSG